MSWCAEDRVGGQWHWKNFHLCWRNVEMINLCCVYAEWVCVFVLQACVPCIHFSSVPPPVSVQMCPNHLSCLFLGGEHQLGLWSREIGPSYLWVRSAPSGGRHGRCGQIFGSLKTLLSSAQEWRWNWPFYWIWWSITAQMEVQLPQGKGDIA